MMKKHPGKRTGKGVARKTLTLFYMIYCIISSKPCAIPGLEGRHLEFLGLLACPYEACSRQNIPADKVF